MTNHHQYFAIHPQIIEQKLCRPLLCLKYKFRLKKSVLPSTPKEWYDNSCDFVMKNHKLYANHSLELITQKMIPKELTLIKKIKSHHGD